MTNFKIQVIADDIKDQKVANQFSELLDWKIVKSKSDKHPKYGYPMGRILCRNMMEAEDFLNNSEFTDCLIEDYFEKVIAGMDQVMKKSTSH